MSETANIENNNVENSGPDVEVKPYEFRRLNSTDMFPMFTIISKIGVNEFTTCFQKDAVKKAIADIIKKQQDHKKDDKQEDSDENAAIVGLSVALEAVNVILANMHKCEDNIYGLLSQTSNLSVQKVKELDFEVFAEMLIDFIKKPEFKGFIKVVSKLFK